MHIKKLLTSHNIAFIFVLLITISSLYSFFSYQIQELPQRIEPAVLTSMEQSILPGEPVYLFSALLDQLITAYPSYNMFPGGGKSRETAKMHNHFYLLTIDGVPADLKNLKDYTMTLQAQEKNMQLYRFMKNGTHELAYRASSFLDKFSVTSFYKKEPAIFEAGMFVTGPQPWHAVHLKIAQIGGKTMEAISAHPLDGDDKLIFITVPPLPQKAAVMVFEGGVADSGRCGQCPPVKAIITQNDKKAELISQDGKMTQVNLDGFSSQEPIHVQIGVKKDGMRHFYFDIVYKMALK